MRKNVQIAFMDGTGVSGKGEVYFDVDNKILYFTTDSGAFFRFNWGAVSYFFDTDIEDE